MKQIDRSYCVAIRTLGKAGEKYQQELDSLVNQTIPPKKILVYIAEGYPLPKETVGVEQYIRVKKGMVAQRAIPFDEVDTDYVLLLDDDVYVPRDGVEKLFDGLEQLEGDAIAADLYAIHKESTISKIRAFVTNWAYPRSNDDYAFKIQRNASFTYNNSPNRDVYLSESAAGAVSLWKIESLRNIHFSDELWMDAIGFAYGDDLLFFYKLVKNHGRLLVHYNSGIVHLDAQSERSKYVANPKRLLLRSQLWFILWWRTCYDLPTLGCWGKFLAAVSFFLKFCWNAVLTLLFSICKLSVKPLWYHVKGTWEGWKYVHGDVYRQVPNFILSANKKEK